MRRKGGDREKEVTTKTQGIEKETTRKDRYQSIKKPNKTKLLDLRAGYDFCYSELEAG